eukprot:CAMPEP_0205882284 /NCGR_PEP_ID=MMETSP1083-20121108/16914_1 /ASSEMBLY_ACC=CAM_ASM_000430 /TAXON_ID=97485 /ORGANISM="Prymnesium parvum, Strain Texoma1" /LENGTH=204 /DNA_ID=CAMNT_0053245431 /DNA_START=26 /DNA_END=641 /DNA_ORIENTATION=+
MAALGDTTSSLFVSKSAFEEAARECALEVDRGDALGEACLFLHTADHRRRDRAEERRGEREQLALVGGGPRGVGEEAAGGAACRSGRRGGAKQGVGARDETRVVHGRRVCLEWKGKRIVAFELNAKFKWEGQVDYDDVSGELLLPYISEDVADADYELKLTAKDPKDSSHKAALKLLEKQRPVIKERLATFTREIYDDTPKEVP